MIPSIPGRMRSIWVNLADGIFPLTSKAISGSNVNHGGVQSSRDVSEIQRAKTGPLNDGMFRSYVIAGTSRGTRVVSNRCHVVPITSS